MQIQWSKIRPGMTIWWVGCSLFNQSERFVESMEIEGWNDPDNIPEVFRHALYTTRKEAEKQLKEKR